MNLLDRCLILEEKMDRKNIDIFYLSIGYDFQIA